MVFWLENSGGCNAHDVTVNVTTDDDYANVVSGQCSFGNIPIGDSASNIVSPVLIKCPASTFNGRVVGLTAEIRTSDGARTQLPIAVSVGATGSTDPIGPESYGYYMYDDIDTAYAPHPIYQWAEIVPSLGGSGIRLIFPLNYDDNSVLVTLPFDLVYYGIHYPKIVVSLNGFVTPDTTRIDMGGHFYHNFYNWPIPDPGNARAQISAFWDDIAYTIDGNVYGVYTWSDSVEQRYVVEWYHMYHRNTNAVETFEIIIDDPTYHPTMTGDAEITYLYNTILNNDIDENYSTIGFEDYSQETGIQYEYDNLYAPGAPVLTNGRAIKITTNTGRGGVKGHVELSNGGHNGGVTVSSSTGQRRISSEAGDYWIKDIPPGTVDILASIDGYFPGLISGVNVNADASTPTINFNLVQIQIPGNLVASDSFPNLVEVQWDSVSSIDLIGYNLYRSRWQDGGFEKLNEFPLQATHCVDMSVQDSTNYWYYVTAVYARVQWHGESFASNKDAGGVNSEVGISDGPAIPRKFFLSQNYPNPFNPTTTIVYGLPKAANVHLDIYNLLGQRVTTLINEYQKAGYNRIIWDGKDQAGNGVSSGVYFYRIEAGNFNESKKMLMLK